MKQATAGPRNGQGARLRGGIIKPPGTGAGTMKRLMMAAGAALVLAGALSTRAAPAAIIRRFIVPAPVPGGFMMPPRNFIDMNSPAVACFMCVKSDCVMQRIMP
jgi:hypothetical protein